MTLEPYLPRARPGLAPWVVNTESAELGYQLPTSGGLNKTYEADLRVCVQIQVVIRLSGGVSALPACAPRL